MYGGGNARNESLMGKYSNNEKKGNIVVQQNNSGQKPKSVYNQGASMVKKSTQPTEKLNSTADHSFKQSQSID